MVIAKTEVETKEQERPSRGLREGMWMMLLCIAVSAAASLPFFFMGRSDLASQSRELPMPVTHDMHLHFEQMKSFHRGLHSGEIYPRWEEDTNRGFGAPTTSYYPPGLYYLTSGLYWLVGDWVKVLIILHLMMMAASGWAIYLYARGVMGRAAAGVAMVAYVVMPYHLVDQYQRGAMAEMLGFIFMPLMLMYGERIFQGSGQGSGVRGQCSRVTGVMRDVGLLGLSYGAWLWSHPPTAYQFSLVYMVYVVVRGWRGKSWRGVAGVGAGLVMGLSISAAYLYPASVEQHLILSNSVEETYPYHLSYVLTRTAPYSETHDAFLWVIDEMWVFSTLMIIIAGIVLLTVRTSATTMMPELRGHIIVWVIIGCFVSFMMTKASYPIGRMIPKIEIGVFTWRMLSISALVLTLLAGACASAARAAFTERNRRRLIVYTFLAGSIVIGGLLYSVARVAAPMYYAPYLTEDPEHLNYVMIPQGAYSDLNTLPKVDRAELAEGNGQVTIERWDSEHRELRVELSRDDRLLIRTFNFPGWTATVDGQRANIVTDERLGSIILELPGGAHRVELAYLDTPARRVGTVVTISTLLLLLPMALAPLIERARYILSESRKTIHAD